MKYILFDNDTVIVFPDKENHASMSEHVDAEPLRAGFCNVILRSRSVQVHGRSMSLNLGSDPKDYDVIREAFFGEEATLIWDDLELFYVFTQNVESFQLRDHQRCSAIEGWSENGNILLDYSEDDPSFVTSDDVEYVEILIQQRL